MISPIKTALMFSIVLALSFGAVANISHGAELGAYGGFTDIKGKQTGFFHTQKIDGRWWLVTPDGHGFWGVGMAHPITGFTQSAVTFTFDGDQEAWLRGTIQRIRDLGFNCVWSGPYCPERLQKGYVDKELARKVFREAEIPYVFPLPLTKHFVELKPEEKRPDVFSDEYTRFVQDMVSEHVPQLKDDPWVMGYYYGFGSWDQDYMWINETIERPDSPGRERLVGILEQRYQGNIERFNVVYGTSFHSFAELKESGSLAYPAWVRTVKNGFKPMPKTPGSQEVYDDAQSLLGEIVEHVYRLAHEAIRKEDPNHMIFGAYVKEATFTAEIWQRIAPYIDVISPQHVSKVFPIGKVVKALDKPALISDQPFGNVYPLRLLAAKKAHGPVPDHVDRIVLYDLLANRISKDPDFIGVDFCACLFDQSHPDKAYELGQPGFFGIAGESKPYLCRTVRKLNTQIMENVRAPHNDEAAEALDEKYHTVLQRYRDVIDDRKALLKENPAIVYPDR